jgi:hypothetical protein
MTELKEYTGKLTINLEITVPAKSEKEALELLNEIYPEITLIYGENVPELISWQDDLDYIDWEIDS